MKPIHEHALIETIRLSEREKDKLVWAVNALPEAGLGADPEALSITPERTDAQVQIVDQFGKASDFLVIAYRYSRYGINLVHGRFVHPDRKCRVRLKSLDGQWHERTGRTGPCLHIKGMIHALRIKLDESIPLDDFAILSSEQELRHLDEMSQDPSAADAFVPAPPSRRVLVVDDQLPDRKLISHWLGQSGIQVSTAATPEMAYKEIATERCDAIITDMLLGASAGSDMIQTLRNQGTTTPILAISADEGQRYHAESSGSNAFLAKPFSDQELLANLRGVMDPGGSPGEPIYSTLANDAGMLPLLTGYVRNVPSQAEALEKASQAYDTDALATIAITLKGSGSSYGFPAVSDAAAALVEALDDITAGRDEVAHATAELVAMLRRVGLRPTA